MSISLPDDVRAALNAGKKIEAIRLLREATGLGLAEAKAAVESGAMPAVSSRDNDAAPMPAHVVEALVAGDKIKAIRLLRKARGIGLKEAKDIIESTESKPRSDSLQNSTGLAPGEVPREKIGPRLWVAIAVVLAAMVWLLVVKR